MTAGATPRREPPARRTQDERGERPRVQDRKPRAGLELERDRYRDLFELAPDAYLVTDLDGLIEDANRAAETMFGVPRRLLLGKSLALYLGGDGSDLQSALRELRRGRPLSERELLLHPRGGPSLHVGVRAVSSGDGPGDGRSLRWLIRDISERVRAEEEIRRANADLEERARIRTEQLEVLTRSQQDLLDELGRERSQLEAVLQQMPGGTVIAEAPSGRFLLANAEAEKILGVPGVAAAAIEDYGRFRGFRPDGRPYGASDWPLARAIVTGEVVSGERVDLVREDGSRVTLELSAAPVRDVDGRIVAGVVTFYDVSERERRARAEREFVTNAAHELRTPLAAIASAIEVLQAGAKDRAPERDRFLAHIDDHSRRLQRLVHSLLVLARAQIGEEAPARKPVPIAPLLDDVARLLEPRDGVAVRVECGCDVLVLANRELLEDVVTNLAANAGKHVEHGEIVLAAGPLADGRVAIEVRDTGRGMTDDERRRATERFYRGRDRNGDGFGLGLAIAAQAVETLGGELAIESTPHVGTAVRVVLPAGSAT